MRMGKKRDDYYDGRRDEDLSHTMLADRKTAAALAAIGLLETVLAGQWHHDVGIGVGCACVILAFFRYLTSVPDVAGHLHRVMLGCGRGADRGASSSGSGSYTAEMMQQKTSAPFSNDVEASASVSETDEPPHNDNVHSAGERAQLVLQMDVRPSNGAGGGFDALAASCDRRMMNSPLRRWLLSALSVILGGFALALAVVHLASPDHGMAHFPTACDARQGCARIALENPWRDDGLAPLTFSAPAKEALFAVLQWVTDGNQPGVSSGGAGGGGSGAGKKRSGERRRVIAIHNQAAEGGGPDGIIVHVRAISFLWGFADDVVVSIRCSGGAGAGAGGEVNGAMALVQVHGQLRLGVGDMGVNPDRNARLWGFLKERGVAGSGHTLAEGAGACVPAPVRR